MTALNSPQLPSNLREQNTESLNLDLDVIEGEIPHDCQGYAFWMVPTPQDGAIPWFNGCAQIYRLDLQEAKDNKVHLKSQSFLTPSVICDRQIDKALEPCWKNVFNWQKLLFGGLFKFQNRGGLARLSPRLGVQNQCNTALQTFQDPENKTWRMFATIDSGRPFELDLTTLKPVTPVGHREEWLALEVEGIPGVGKFELPWIFPMNMSGAHPAYDEKTREIFLINPVFDIELVDELNVSLDRPETRIHIWHGRQIGEGKSFHTAQILDDRTNEPVIIKQSTHQIVITENYLVIIDTAFRIEYDRMLFEKLPARTQNAHNQVWLVPREQLSTQEKVVAKHIEIPHECVHFFADRDDNGGESITLHLVLASGHDVSEWVQPTDTTWTNKAIDPAFYGAPPGVYDKQGFAKCVINAKTGKIVSQENCLFEEFWGVALPTYQGIQGTSPAKFENIWVNYTGCYSEMTPKRLIELYGLHPFREVPIYEIPASKPAGILRWSPVEMKVTDFYAVEPGFLVTSPIYIPKEGQTHELEGYIATMVTTPTGSEFWLWQAGNLKGGPIAKLRHKEVKFAFSLHSAWSPKIAPRNSDYKVNVREDMNASDSKYFLPGWIKEIFEKYIYPEFE